MTPTKIRITTTNMIPTTFTGFMQVLPPRYHPLAWAEPEYIHDPVFRLTQLSWRLPFHREYIPSRTTRYSALGRFYECLVFMQAATVTPTISPSGLIVAI